MNIVEKYVDYVKKKAINTINDPKWKDVSFKKKKTFNERLRDAESVLLKYPDRVPVICERAKADAPILDRKKYLVPNNITVGEFMFVIRKRMKLSPEISIYLFVGENNLAPVSQTMGVTYHTYKDKDKFLYIKYCKEATFG